MSFIRCSKFLALTLSTKFNKLFFVSCFIFWLLFFLFKTLHKHFKYLKQEFDLKIMNLLQFVY